MFYSSLVGSLRSIIDVAAGGFLMSKPFDETYALIDRMTDNNFQLLFERLNPRKLASVYEYSLFRVLW